MSEAIEAQDTTAKKRAPMVRGWITGHTIAFHQGDEKLDEISLTELPQHLLGRYALEGIARVYSLGAERSQIVSGEGLPKRDKPVAATPVDKEREKLLAKLAKAEEGARELRAMLDAKNISV